MRLTWFVATAALVVGCSSTPRERAPEIERAYASEAPRATYRMVDPPPIPTPYHAMAQAWAPPSLGKRTLFLNRGGGLYRRGWENSSSNTSSLLFGSSARIPAYGGGAAAWSSLVACVTEKFSRWNVTVTDEDPGMVPHIEAVVGGRPSLLDLPPNVGGVAPMTMSGVTLERAVVYVFSDAIVGLERTCEIATHEIGHAIGLEHAYLCEDPMSYLQGCGAKAFQDKAAWCGESAPRACRNGGKQNSVQFLGARLGLAKAPPKVEPKSVEPPPVDVAPDPPSEDPGADPDDDAPPSGTREDPDEPEVEAEDHRG